MACQEECALQENRDRTRSEERLKELLVKKRKNIEPARVRTQGPLMETAKVGTLVHLKQTARGEDPRTFKEQV